MTKKLCGERKSIYKLKTMIKTKRNLSGIYLSFKNPETDKIENRVFEDLPSEEQDKIMKDRDIKWLKGLAKQLANTINDVADKFDIIS